MKKPGLLAASMAAAASAITAVTGSTFKIQTSHQDHGASCNSSSSEKMNSCSEKFAPRFDGLRFIETLVTAHR